MNQEIIKKNINKSTVFVLRTLFIVAPFLSGAGLCFYAFLLAWKVILLFITGIILVMLAIIFDKMIKENYCVRQHYHAQASRRT